MKLKYCSATLSPYYPTLKPSVTQSKTYPQTKPLNLAISLSQSWLSLSQSCYHLPHKYSHSPFQSCNLPHSTSPSRFRSPSRYVPHALGLPFTRYVLLSLHLQFEHWVFVGICVCKFCIFMCVEARCVRWIWVYSEWVFQSVFGLGCWVFRFALAVLVCLWALWCSRPLFSWSLAEKEQSYNEYLNIWFAIWFLLFCFCFFNYKNFEG